MSRAAKFAEAVRNRPFKEFKCPITRYTDDLVGSRVVPAVSARVNDSGDLEIWCEFADGILVIPHERVLDLARFMRENF